MGKVCSTCRLERPLSEFWGRPSAVDGLRGTCISCCKSKHADWMAKNRSKKQEQDRQYWRENASDINARSRADYAENPEAVLISQRQWRADNPQKVTAQNRRKRFKHGDDLRSRRRQHYLDNKARYKAQAVARKKYIRQATPSWADLDAIAAIYAEAERLSLETGIDHHVDHFYPLRGKTMCGLHVEGNLRIIPKLDNLRKGNSVPVGIAGMLGI